MSGNQQRAAEVLGFRELEDAKTYARDDLERIAAAMDEAEARGRAEAAVRIEELLIEVEESDRSQPNLPIPAERLRSLVADLMAPDRPEQQP